MFNSDHDTVWFPREDKAPGMFSVHNDIRNEEVFSDRVNGRLRRTPEERQRFSETCSPQVCSAAKAMRDRFKELAIRAPFADDDTAWPDLADTAIRSAAKVTREMQIKANADLQQAMKDHNG